MYSIINTPIQVDVILLKITHHHTFQIRRRVEIHTKRFKISCEPRSVRGKWRLVDFLGTELGSHKISHVFNIIQDRCNHQSNHSIRSSIKS